jgi:hypothetical protein
MSDEKDGWALYQDNEEKSYRFYNIDIKFSIRPGKHAETVLSYTCEAHDGVCNRYKIKGNTDYAKKIVENTVIAFDNTPIDCGDIDLCLRKAFSLQKKSIKHIRRIKHVRESQWD